MPKYHQSIYTYLAQLSHREKQYVLASTADSFDLNMHINMGGGLPSTGFYEMKQEIFEIAKKWELINQLKH